MKENMSLKDVCEETGLSSIYVRRCILNKSLKSTKGVVEGTKIPKNYIKREDFENWNKIRSQKSKREDGRNKFIIYMNLEEKEFVTKLLLENGIELPINKAYNPKEEEVEVE